MQFHYRLTEAKTWLTAQHAGFFASPDLLVTGFIHASPWRQVLTTANLYFPDEPELLALEIDPALLREAGVEMALVWREERQETFAHIFGAIPISAIRRVLELRRDAIGEFYLQTEPSG
ncbi:DUF952 domain-containing protein [Hymenobacter sp. HSC-4F20]|uniref:DUF952 domain-containing protein n=1 Tax=Hymenobacter sp. HSC-4F20 TaxID=2864135 RepID=UPI001C73129F|nr:DUF952 domain-containing protein [Hymenobacter sp. HSC-4F20]MBX0288990.1 DUF952 domain-containing protein [Hymenobacter sp. HSC-4F20]